MRAADPRFALNDESLPLVIDICRRLDGLPLAIELAAARVATLGLRPVRDKLDARFKLLTGGARATLRRHQTLRAALEWSHNLLNDDGAHRVPAPRRIRGRLHDRAGAGGGERRADRRVGACSII